MITATSSSSRSIRTKPPPASRSIRVHDAIAERRPDAGSEALMLVYALVAGVLFGLYFSLVGLGLNLVFGVMRIVNLAHGDFLMLGGFLAFWLFNLYAINPIPAVVIAFALFLLAGLPIYYLLVPRLLAARDPEMLSIILFFGFSQVIEAIATIAFRTSERSIPGVALGNAVAWVGHLF